MQLGCKVLKIRLIYVVPVSTDEPPPSAINILILCSSSAMQKMTMLNVCLSASLWCLLGCISSSSSCSRE